jgi:hypothetical protein
MGVGFFVLVEQLVWILFWTIRRQEEAFDLGVFGIAKYFPLPARSSTFYTGILDHAAK